MILKTIKNNVYDFLKNLSENASSYVFSMHKTNHKIKYSNVDFNPNSFGTKFIQKIHCDILSNTTCTD